MRGHFGAIPGFHALPCVSRIPATSVLPFIYIVACQKTRTGQRATTAIYCISVSRGEQTRKSTTPILLLTVGLYHVKSRRCSPHSLEDWPVPVTDPTIVIPPPTPNLKLEASNTGMVPKYPRRRDYKCSLLLFFFLITTSPPVAW